MSLPVTTRRPTSLAPALFALLATATALPPLAGPTALAAQPAPSLSHRKVVLDNGLEVILHEDHSVPIVAVNTWYKVGSGDEEPGRTGFAHLFEHVMFMGSQHVPVGKFDEWLEAAERSAIDPMTGHEYGCPAPKSTGVIVSLTRPYGTLSTRCRRSFFTTSRCTSSFGWSIVGSR
jgi:hypothetical protein